MALLDLSRVTRTLVTLVREVIAASPASPTPLNVTSLPPDKFTEDNSVGIYLYHLSEEAAVKNQPWRGRPDTPIRYSPLALNLHYVVTASSTATDEHGPYREQQLMGLAVKALHDYPVIDDATEVLGVKILDSLLVGDENKLRIALRHVPVSEAVSYWTAGSHALRLSAYYEVSVVLLEPEEPVAAAGRVLTWGVETFIGGLPRLTASRSTVRFTIPGEPSARAIEVQPAQAAIGDEVVVFGTGLGGGSLELVVRGPGWPAGAVVGPGWGVSGAGDQVYFTVQDLIDALPTLPGAYTAAVRITRTATLPDGRAHTTTVSSNETPFQIAPAVRTITGPVAGVFTIDGGLFADATATVVTRVSVAAMVLAPGTLGALAAGEFAIASASTIEFTLPTGAPSGEHLPVRVIVNGSESPPRWVQVP
ncbi:MAG: DUF4255 domain-containing protein [Myxococcales bacterium]|nr:DUF4255 domain-containing protein [Myxococcales bacterium]